MSNITNTTPARPTVAEVLADGRWHSVAHVWSCTGTNPVQELFAGMRAGTIERSIGKGGYPIVRAIG